MNSYEKVLKLCDSRNIAISRLEKNLGFSNGSLKGRGTGFISYERLEKIAKYFDVDINEVRDDDLVETLPEQMNSVEFVKKMCEERKIPLSRLEKDCGFANGYISQLKKGVFPNDRLQTIANYLNVSIDYISNCGEQKEVFTIDLDELSNDKKQFAEDLINIYLAGVYSDEETFNLIRKGLAADLDMVMALLEKNKK